jgi:hypothetical protein
MQTGVAAADADKHTGFRSFVWAGVVMAIAVATTIVLMAVLGGRARDQAAPTVVRTSPVAGAIIAPGTMKLSVTFDRRMRPGNFSFVQKDPATFPKCNAMNPVQSADGRTFTLACTVEPNRSYEVWFNSEPYMNFKAMDGTPAVPFQLNFRTRR